MIGSILHQEGIGIWDNNSQWSVQNGININYTSGDAVVGSGADFTLAPGSHYHVDAVIQFKVSGMVAGKHIVVGHGLSNNVVNGFFIPEASGVLSIVKDGTYTLRYTGVITQTSNIYNCFLLVAEQAPEILDAEYVALVFRQV